MKFLNYIQESFPRVLAVDTEFRLDSTKTIPEKVICFVYTDVFTGEVFRYWEHNKTMSERHFDYEDVLLKLRKKKWIYWLKPISLPSKESRKL